MVGVWLTALALAANANIETFTLDNGLRVVLERDSTFPIIAVTVHYGVGSGDDPPGKPGLSHLVEHIACEHTEHLGQSTIMEQLGLRGATSVNAMTWPDATRFVETIPASELDAALWVESERMGFLVGGLKKKDFEHERAIVRQEREHHAVFDDDRPGTDRIWEALFRSGHPYSQVHVTRADALGLDDVTGWIDRYYGPSNAVLTLVGDLPSDTRERINVYFKDLSAKGVRPVRPPVPVNIARAVDYEKTDATYFTTAWVLPSRSAGGYTVGNIVAHLLYNRDRRLRPGEPADIRTSAHLATLQLASIFSFSAWTHENATAERLDALLRTRLQELHDTVDDLAIRQATRRVYIGDLMAHQTYERRAAGLGSDVLFGRSTAIVQPPIVSTAEVQQFIASLLAAPLVTR